MANHTPSMPLSRIAAATALSMTSTVWAQTAAQPQELVITSPAPQQVSGLGDVPLSKAPFSGVNIDAQTLRDIGATRISDALRLDASVSDSYNSPAYWDILSVRGYTLDNRYNYRREGLPISAETMIPMENKERIELFKGTSGIQAGTSAPGGLANYVVKRAPTGNDDTIRSVTASYGNGKSSSLALDLGARFGENKDFGYRFNAAYEDLNPYIRNTQGHRNLIALAMDWRITPDSKLEWEFERSERQQIGVNGYSLLANRSDPSGPPAIPQVVNGKSNLTLQNWSVPGLFQANTGTIRFKQNLNDGWLWTTSYGSQRLHTDDRLTFASGYNCYGTLGGPTSLCDRFTSDGRFELTDYRSDNERRLIDAFKTEASGQAKAWGFDHTITIGIMRYRQLDRLPPLQAWNSAGWGSMSGDSSSQANATPSYPNTNKTEYNTELSLSDRISLNATTNLWLGLRQTHYSRSTERNAVCDPVTYECIAAPQTNPVSNRGNLTTPWLGMTWLADEHMLYASYGEGVELSTVPNSPSYANAGKLLDVAKSRQVEIGVRSPISRTGFAWNSTVFMISRPLAYDWSGARYQDGKQQHTGLDLGASWRNSMWLLQGQAQLLQAQIKAVSLYPAQVGDRPLNVPAVTLRALAQYRWADVPGLRTSLRLSHEGERRVLEDGSLNLPAWTTVDFAAHYDTRVNGIRTEWTLAIDNLTDKHYWRESPKQFGHYYLYPGAPRTGRITVRTSF